MPSYSTSSAQRLLTCDHRLQRLFGELIKEVDHSILCGYRNKEDQDWAYETGHSKLQWPHSKHNVMPSQAVDAAPFPLEPHEIQRYIEFASVVKEMAARLGIKIRWGGDFHTFKDYAHWELVD